MPKKKKIGFDSDKHYRDSIKLNLKLAGGDGKT